LIIKQLDIDVETTANTANYPCENAAIG